MSVFRRFPVPTLTCIACLSAPTFADIGKVYHPNVEPQRKELEYRVTGYNDGDDNPDFQTHHLSFGYGISDRIAIEGGLTGEKVAGNALQLEAYELLGRWQLNEPGVEWLDGAMLFRIEHAEDGSYSEVGTGFLAEKALDAHWTATANIIVNYVFGDDVSEKLEGEMVAQVLYRANPQFSPGLEAYWDEDIIGFGPAIAGTIAVDGQRRLTWEVAALLTVEHDIADKVFRGSLNWGF